MRDAWHNAAVKAAREEETNPDAAAIAVLYEKFARNTLRKRRALKFQLSLRMLGAPSCWCGVQQRR